MNLTPMQKVKTTFLLIILALSLGAVVAGATWILLKIMSTCINLVWNIGQEYFNFTLYPLIVCAAGGVIIGLWSKKFGPYPQELNEVMGEVKKTGGYPYDNLPVLAVSALLPLIFGGCLGPEAGLTGVIAGFCTWVGHRFKYSIKEIRDIAQIGMSATLGVIFGSPLFGFIAPFEEETKSIVLPKKAKTLLYFTAIFGGLGMFTLLNSIFVPPMQLPRFGATDINTSELVWYPLLLLFGVAGGYLYYLSGAFLKKAFQPLKKYPVIKCILGGVILGGVGIFLPYTMFAGESQMEIIMAEWESMTIAILFLTGFIKLIMGNICFYSGWRGGNIFPIIFSGLCLGYGIAQLVGIDSIYCVLVTTASLVAMVMRKPLMSAMVLILCFPIDNLIILLISSFLGAAFPLPKCLLPEESKNPQNDNAG